MKLKVSGRDYWDEELKELFGNNEDNVFDFPDNSFDFLKFVSRFGRFEMIFLDSNGKDLEIPKIVFHNGYD